MKAAIEKPDRISLEIIDIQANPELADAYSAQSVPQTYVNETLIAEGAQQEELFLASLEKMEQQTFFIPDRRHYGSSEDKMSQARAGLASFG